MKLEPELHLEIPVLVKRTVEPEFRFKPESQLEPKYYSKCNYLHIFMQKQICTICPVKIILRQTPLVKK